MTAAVGLLVYSGFALAVGPRLLVRSTTGGRAPRLGIVAWQVACWSVIGSWILAGAVIALPSLVPVDGLGGLLHTCLVIVRQAVAPHGSRWLRLLGGAVAILTGARVGSCLLHGLWAQRRCRSRHLAAVTMVGRRRGELDAVVVECADPIVYCLPGWAGRVVATTGALDRLSPDQLSAVLAHERAHLRGRHHLVLGAAHALLRAFPMVRLFTLASAHTARLVEMCADDAAARRHSRRHVAEALVVLADRPAPRGALAASGVHTIQRVERLLTDRGPAAVTSSRLVVLAALFASGPMLSVVAPVLVMALRHWGLCPLPR